MWRLGLICTCLAAGPAWAQEDERDYLTAFLEDTLSDAGRKVTVTGFEGALASRATMDSLTIADDQGIWITLNGVVLDWSRSSLLSGDLEINELSAAEIIIDRMPVASDSGLPSAEASGFSLPELPVTIDVTRIAASRIELGPEVFGEAISGTLAASMSLANGEGQGALDIVRTDDGPEGRITLDAAYANASGKLDLSLLASEEAGGVTVKLLGVPDAPAARFQIEGTGTIDDFLADISLATDGEDRLSGTVEIRNEAASGHRLTGQVSGNLVPVLAPEMVDFFGPAVALSLDAIRSPAGRITVEHFDLSSRALNVTGSARLAPDGLPEFFDLQGQMASPDGKPVLLPLPGPPTRVDRAEISMRSEQGEDDSWSGSIRIVGLDQDALDIEVLELDGSGRIGRSTAGRSFGGTLKLAATGIAPSDPDLAQAIGPTLSGQLRMHFVEGMLSLRLSDLSLIGTGYEVAGALEIAGLDQAFLASGNLGISTSDFSRFSGLLGRPVGGSGTLSVAGSASRLSGFFDARIEVAGKDLKTGVSELDRLLADGAEADASIRRDESGTTLRAFALDAGKLTARASGRLSSKGSSLTGRLDLADLSALGPGYAGSLSLEGGFEGTLEAAKLQLDGSAQSLRSGNRELDKLLAGRSQLQLRLAIDQGALQIEDGRFDNPQLRMTASGRIDGTTRNITLDARLTDLGLFAPGFSGALTILGDATQDATGYSVKLAGSGPGQVKATVEGRIANDFGSAALLIRGTGRAELANLLIQPRAASGPIGFDLRLNGPLSASSLSGRITLTDGRISDPQYGISLNAVEAIGTIQGGTLRLAATSGLSSGGRLRIDGPIGLAPPYNAELTMALDSLRLFDPELYETLVSGNLSLAGPISGGARLSGRLQLSGTEVRVPSSGFSSTDAQLAIDHRNEPRDVRTTRERAMLIPDSSAGGTSGAAVRPLVLDLVISAPNKIFVRGRGIDAELGGELRLAGTTANVVPSGSFSLVRGRMDILGKRLILSQADLSLEGRLVPEILISATADSGDVLSIVTVEGPADDPQVTFSSVPELPQEEALAQLLFGRGIENLSAFQAAQLASAIATLAGRGGEGLIERLRRNTGLDDLDVTVAEDGATSLKAGKYIAENAYTELEVDQEGRSRINLNLDLREGITVKGRLGADGETGVGVFIEKDY